MFKTIKTKNGKQTNRKVLSNNNSHGIIMIKSHPDTEFCFRTCETTLHVSLN